MDFHRFLKLLISLSAVGGAWCAWASEPQQNVSDQTLNELLKRGTRPGVLSSRRSSGGNREDN